MGLGSFLFDVGKGALNSLKEKEERVNKLKSEYKRYNDNDLMNKFKTSSGETKIAIAMLLKERGHGKKS